MPTNALFTKEALTLAELDLIAKSADRAESYGGVRCIERSLPRHTKPRVEQSVHVDVQMNFGVNRLKRELVDGPPPAKIGGANASNLGDTSRS